jgi:hypothetical protein
VNGVCIFPDRKKKQVNIVRKNIKNDCAMDLAIPTQSLTNFCVKSGMQVFKLMLSA